MKPIYILTDISFEKSLPRENKKEILEKISNFISEWQYAEDKKKVNIKYSVKKIKGGTQLKAVWKFKVSPGNRVLFIRGKDLEWEDPKYKQSIILLEFCTHDKQIIMAQNKSKVVIESMIEANVEEICDKRAQQLQYNPEDTITRTFKYIDIEHLIDVERLQGVFYLNKQQRECVNKNYSPLLLFGSAGSGKTVIGVYKLIQLIKENEDIKVGYFTYSTQLANSAKEIYQKVRENEFSMTEIVEQKSVIDFYPIKNLLKEYSKKHCIVEYEQFKSDFYKPLYANLMGNLKYKGILKKIESYDIWKEIRGIIKGFTGENWIPNTSMHQQGILSKEAYLKLGMRYSSFDASERLVIYEITLKYMAWLKLNNRYDENDLCRLILNSGSNLAKYDWIVIDEIQDLSELEFYLLRTFVKEPHNFLISGDYNQTITPTYFDTRRILSFLEIQNLRYPKDENRIFLRNNYRNPKNMVNLANHLSDLRQVVFGKDKRNDGDYEIAMQNTKGYFYALGNNSIEKINFLKEAIKKAYTYIVVPSEKEKEELETLLQDDTHIFTISEIKGLENRYIICVNLFATYSDKWRQLLDSAQSGERIEESNLYRYLFNMAYVAITRTRESICFIDDVIDPDWYEVLFGMKPVWYDKFNIEKFNLLEESDMLDFYKEAIKFEKAGKYKRAIAQYSKISFPEVPQRIKECKAKLLAEEGHFKEAGDLYFEMDFIDEALDYYKLVDYYEGIYECLLSKGEDVFIEQVINRVDYNYEKDMLPYFSEKLRKKIEVLCLKQCLNRLTVQEEETTLRTLYTLEMNDRLITLNKKLERNHNE